MNQSGIPAIDIHELFMKMQYFRCRGCSLVSNLNYDCVLKIKIKVFLMVDVQNSVGLFWNSNSKVPGHLMHQQQKKAAFSVTLQNPLIIIYLIFSVKYLF